MRAAGRLGALAAAGIGLVVNLHERPHDAGELGVALAPPRRVGGVRVLCVSRGRLLVVHHEDPASGESFWVLPGGGRERGETLAEAAVREVYEETGIAVRVVRRLRIPPTVPYRNHALFLAEALTDGEPRPTVDLGGERYLRGAAWYRLDPAQPLGPLTPAFWEHLAPRMRRLLAT